MILKNVFISIALTSVLSGVAIAEDKAAPTVEAKKVEAKASPAGDANADTVKAAIDAAKSAQKAANAVGGEWRDIGKFLKTADKLASEGDFAKAEKLAKKAESQAKLGKAQMEGQSNIAFPAFFTK